MTSARTGQFGFSEFPGAATVTQQLRRLAPSRAWSRLSGRTIPVWAVVSAAVTPVLLTTAWLIADALQSASYSPVRQTLSVLAGRAGTDRWIMTVALLVAGGCYLATAAGLTDIQGFGRVLLTVAGVASICVAVSPEPAHGSTPQHLAWTALGEFAIAIWPAFAARRTASRTAILTVRQSMIMTAVSIALLGWLVIETQHGSALGLAERLSLPIQTSFPFLVALALRRSRGTNNPVECARQAPSGRGAVVSETGRSMQREPA